MFTPSLHLVNKSLHICGYCGDESATMGPWPPTAAEGLDEGSSTNASPGGKAAMASSSRRWCVAAVANRAAESRSTNAAARGRPLRAGEFVTLGSLVATRWVKAGDEVRIEVDGLGEAAARFA